MASQRKKGSPHKWRPHQLAQSNAHALRVLTQGVRRVMTRVALESPPPSAPARTIALPELPDDPVEKAVLLLQTAAEIEHALMVQYLYSGNGFSQPNRDIIGVAIEEMSHLMTVQNLLRVIGAGPQLDRQGLGPPSAAEERLFPFNSLLEPITHISLANTLSPNLPRRYPRASIRSSWDTL